MSRGGYRKGAGRKREYQEPVQKILLGLPESVLLKLDTYAKEHHLSRPKAIALLLESIAIPVGLHSVGQDSNQDSPSHHSHGTHLIEKKLSPSDATKLKPDIPQTSKATKKQKLLDELKALKNSLGN